MEYSRWHNPNYEIKKNKKTVGQKKKRYFQSFCREKMKLCFCFLPAVDLLADDVKELFWRVERALVAVFVLEILTWQ